MPHSAKFVAAMLATAIIPAVSACDSNSVAVDATVIGITRSCLLAGSETNTQNKRYADCSTDPEFAQMREGFDNGGSRYEGTATIRVAYVSPIDGTSQQGTVEFDGDEAGFYNYRVNDAIRINVNKTDHSAISAL
ncbi:MAG: hypothetical protein MUF41_06400 [Sphingopyxis sp.]|jgi:hypothetical protein|nr:hypothetical protein [Sphingopyxis sp.]